MKRVFKHTEGPWRIKPDIVRSVPKDTIYSSHGSCVADIEPYLAGSKANANLIAQAPEMLKQLEICLAHMATTSTIWDDTERIINKAKGV